MTSSPDSSQLAAAFDGAIRRVERLLVAHADATPGSPEVAPIATQLARLRAELLAERVVAIARGAADPGWVRQIVRDVAAWAPEDEITLLAALGAIARLAGQRTP